MSLDQLVPPTIGARDRPGRRVPPQRQPLMPLQLLQGLSLTWERAQAARAVGTAVGMVTVLRPARVTV
eukprot:scaffold302477_cov31-Tisochrysis_lutea.AAC.3